MTTTATEIPIGERVRFYRQAQQKKQAVVAGLAGITEDYLSQIERGVRTPTVPLLHRLSRILDVPVAALFGEPSFEPDSTVHPIGAVLQRTLTSYHAVNGDHDAAELGLLRTRLGEAWTTWQTSRARFSETAALIPELVADVQSATRSLRRHDDAGVRREACRLAADMYFLLRTFTKRIGRPDLALLVADRGVSAAEDADDPLRVAAAKWNLGQILLSRNEPESAEELAICGVRELRRALPEQTPDRAALEGALWLVAAVAAARNGDCWTARDRLRDQAMPAAEVSGDGNVFWTVFGPTNVMLHSVSVEMEAGETAEALRLADRVDLASSPSLERRTTFAIEVARCYELRREDAAVFLHLLNAESTGPEDLRYNVMARDLVRGLLKRARPTYASQVNGLAGRIGLYA
ncbi:helix-turn-helix domain-containing protein [Bailinhaonella thermotolerans]|uniref:XRE family transcriptional regulator n=1 Tax=Bailinhaonella thermotolerans TaxID=1070861 RepID=A0A3A4AXE4_9ACTN|nr:helix-turn-helix transcriptional regulator [Bailinhaonella thermotolerans]RJL33089.1 XRE family transcriptional regulator [Bailinhaonella thermotolerans]